MDAVYFLSLAIQGSIPTSACDKSKMYFEIFITFSLVADDPIYFHISQKLLNIVCPRTLNNWRSNRFSIEESPLSSSGRKELFHHWIIHYSNFDLFIYNQTDGDTDVRKFVDKISCPIYRIDYPRWIIRQFRRVTFLRGLLFSDESIFQNKLIIISLIIHSSYYILTCA